MLSSRVIGVSLLLPALMGTGDGNSPVSFSAAELKRIMNLSPLPPLPADPTNAVADNAAAARLGQFLFFDTRLSQDGRLSCGTCHDPALDFSDGRQLALGLGPGKRHTPSLWNIAHNRWLFWDGRADTLWAQALQPIESPTELGSSRLAVAHLIRGDSQLRAAYEALFGPLPELADERRFPREGRPVEQDPQHPHHLAWAAMAPADQEAINRIFANAGKSIAAYERRLLSRDSDFDRFADGLRTADAHKIGTLSESAQRGLKLFIGSSNCILCHHGPNFTDGEFHDIRVPPLGGGGPQDPGRFAGAEHLLANAFNAAGLFSDDRNGPAADKIRFLSAGSQSWGQFKTPSLRNVARTSPYMHQGQFPALRAVVRYYSTFEGALSDSHHPEQILKPLGLTTTEIDDLVAFLESLNGRGIDPALLERPDSPLLQEQSRAAAAGSE